MIFISYSHADRDQAEALAHELTAQGQKVWWDRWDIKAGDSLIQKIFEEGIGEATAFLVLLSKSSIDSDWVREELDQATVRRIEGVTRVIPVLLDDVSFPVSLRTLKWVDLRGGVDHAVEEIIHAVEGIRERPQIGERPGYLLDMPRSVGSLSPLATKVGLALLSSIDPDEGARYEFSGEELIQATELQPSELNDGVDELESFGLVRTLKTLGSAPFRFYRVIPTYALFDQFSEVLSYSPTNDVMIVANTVAARGSANGEELEQQTGLSAGRLNRAVRYLKDYGLVDTSDWLGIHPYRFGQVRSNWRTRQHADEMGR